MAAKKRQYFTISVQETLDGNFCPVCHLKIGDAIEKFSSYEDAEKRVQAMIADPNWSHPIRYRINRTTTEEVSTITDDRRLLEAEYWESMLGNVKKVAEGII